MKTVPIQALPRSEKGSRACRKLRKQGFVPANLYGPRSVEGKTEVENVMLKVAAYDVMQLLERHLSLLEVTFDGRKELVQLYEVQRDALGDNVVHVDLYKIDANKPITSEVELVFKGEPKGVKEGGQLHIEQRVIELEALPFDMPSEIVVRVDDLGIDQTLQVKDLQLPAGVTAQDDPEQILAHVVQPMEQTEEELTPSAGGPAEPEVISKGKKEEAEESD